jgi:hypothetical protein
MNSIICSLVVAVTLLQAAPAQNPKSIVLRGRLVCFENGKRVDPVADSPDVRYALQDAQGKLYPFSRSDDGAAMFVDPRVRRLDLQVTVQTASENEFQVIKVQSIHNGKLYDIYYFCELCNIKAYAPGLCPCCRNEMEFRETPN